MTAHTSFGIRFVSTGREAKSDSGIGVRLLLVAVLAVVLAIVPALSASAATIHDFICDLATDAGFTDVPADSPHKADIDCLKYWGITSQTGTFDPKGEVTRWQMALFMVRTHSATNLYAGSGEDQGFTDIGGLSPEFQTAINQVKQLSITTGTTPTTYAPDQLVTRWQMALFLTRLVYAAGVDLPPPAPHGFTDVGDLPKATQDAISQLKTMGITAGTTPTTFGPDQVVTREQMASFLIRTLKVTWRFDTLFFANECDGELPEVCIDSETIWTLGVGEPFTLRHGGAFDLPFSLEDSQTFNSPDTRVEYELDGESIPATAGSRLLDGVVFGYFHVELTSAVPATKDLEVRWYDDGVHILTTQLTIAWE
jgi:hypothetical protein